MCQTNLGLAAVPDIVERVRASGNDLRCVIVNLEQSLYEISFPEGLEDIPLAIRAPTAGRYAELSDLLPKLRAHNLRVYLPADSPDNIAALQVLASLGVHCCAEFARHGPSWDALADLAAYAMLSRCAHATVEPFAFISSHFIPYTNVQWGRVVFDDPEHFLHLDEQGRVALSADDLAQERFVAQSVEEVSRQACRQLADYSHRWRGFFRDDHACASCPGWRLCLGRFAQRLDEDDDCAAFFEELVDTAMQRYALKQGESQEQSIWQP